MIVTAPRPRFLHTTGVPHIHFPPYDRAQSLAIIGRVPLPIFPPPASSASSGDDASPPPKNDEAESLWLWTRFASAVWDSLAKGAARDIVSFRSLCERLWPPFVQPIRDGHYGTRDFSKLLVKNRVLFQAESALVESVLGNTPDDDNANSRSESLSSSRVLPHYTLNILSQAPTTFLTIPNTSFWQPTSLRITPPAKTRLFS